MRHRLLAVAMFIVPTAVSGQIVAGSIDPGMSRAQVIERLGTPASERAMNGFTYLLYENGCERVCGMTDLVTLQGDSVVDAIFRASARQYTGVSSSPRQGVYGPTRMSLALEGDESPRGRRDRGQGSSGFALPAEWTGAAPATAGAAAVSIDSIVLQITAAPTPSREAGRKSVLPAEWLDPSAVTPPAASAPAARRDSTPKPASILPADWLDPSAVPTAPAPAAAKAPPPSAAAPTSSLLPAEWLGATAPAPGTPTPTTAAPPPAPEKPRKSVLPAEWLDPAAGAPPAGAQRQPARVPPSDTARKPLIPAEWLTPATGTGTQPPPVPAPTPPPLGGTPSPGPAS